MAASPTIFVYNGSDRRKQVVKGEISAISIVEAKNQLRRQGISAKKVKKTCQTFVRQW